MQLDKFPVASRIISLYWWQVLQLLEDSNSSVREAAMLCLEVNFELTFEVVVVMSWDLSDRLFLSLLIEVNLDANFRLVKK